MSRSKFFQKLSESIRADCAQSVSLKYLQINKRKGNLAKLDAASIHQPASFTQVSFDLQKALKKLPIKGLNNSAQYKAITDALKVGQPKEVTLRINDTDYKYFVSTAPHKKTVDVLDNRQQLVDLNKLPGGHLSAITKKLFE